MTTVGAQDARAALAGLPGAGFDWGVLASARGAVDVATARHSAVLILFGARDGRDPRLPVAAADADVLLLERATTLRHHPGQIAFPGGGVEPQDADATATALREAVEETGLDPAGVEAFAPLPDVPLSVSDNLVTPVPAWWRHPSPVHAVDAAETASVFRAPVAALLDPANRRSVTRVGSMRTPPMPAFQVEGRLVWGFTGIVLSGMFDALGWTRPWDPSRTVVPVR